MIRAAILVFAKPSRRPKVLAIAEQLALGMREQGAQAEVILAHPGHEVKLTGFHYIAVGCDVRAVWKGTLPTELAPLLSQGGILTGKKAFAFVVPSLLGTSKTLSQLMRALEREGMLLRYSDILSKGEQAKTLGRRLKLDRPVSN